MSWEQMRPTTKPCPCGKGTITCYMETDDWLRVRHYETIDCATCKAKADAKHRFEVERERERDTLLAEARHIAEKRYLDRWLAMYAGKNKKAVWQLYTGGEGYPALGTFYQHVKSAGSVDQYLRDSFSYDFQKALRQMKVKDREIEKLLSQRNKIHVRPNAEVH